jgi:hypothetical protein
MTQTPLGKDLEDRIGEAVRAAIKAHANQNDAAYYYSARIAKDAAKDLKQLFIDTFMGVVGEDKPVPRPLDDESRARFYRVSGQNFTRHQIRAALNTIKEVDND